MLCFYVIYVFDLMGGFYYYFCDDGSIYNCMLCYFVSSCWFVFNYVMVYCYFGDLCYFDYVCYGLYFLCDVYWDDMLQGYDWEFDWCDGVKCVMFDGMCYCYGFVFVLFVVVYVMMVGIDEVCLLIVVIYEFVEYCFWDVVVGLYVDDVMVNWNVLLYCGQNVNMYMMEVLFVVYEVIGYFMYFDCVEKFVIYIMQCQVVLLGGFVWEYYYVDWLIDWDYNKEDSLNIFCLWSFQFGYQIEWVKLLLIFEWYCLFDWFVLCVVELFDVVFMYVWDVDYGGLYYGFGFDFMICDYNKYFWVQVEIFVVVVMFGVCIGSECFWDWYDEIWCYSWVYFVDYCYGVWYWIFICDNCKYSDEKSLVGKIDYYMMGVCYDVFVIFVCV